jgi:hypothetical protein
MMIGGNHVNGRRVSPFLTRPAFQCRFKCPNERVAGSAYGVKWNAGLCFAAVALDFKPAVTAIQALRDRR